MKLKIILPTGIMFEKEVQKVVAESENGLFCLKPRHIDFVANLVPGLLMYETEGEGEQFVAVDEGILLKCGSEVYVATHNAIRGKQLEELRAAVEENFLELDEKQRKARSALANLEANLVRRFVELEHG